MKANRKFGVGDFDFWLTHIKLSLARYADTRWVNFVKLNKRGGNWELLPGSKIIGDDCEV